MMSSTETTTTEAAFTTNSNANTKAHFLHNHHNDKMNQLLVLSRRYEQLLNTEKYHDCTFHIAGCIVKCHKLLLSSASPVFEAMFYGPLSDQREQQPEIDITDMSPKMFKELLLHIYAGHVHFDALTLEETIELYYGAEKYLLSELVADCLVAIACKLRFANILPALELSFCLDLQGLWEVCMSFFTRCCLSDPQYMSYLKANYMHVSKKCIKGIIAANKAVYQQLLWFVYEWCQRECNELGLQQSECDLIIDDLELKQHGLESLKPVAHMPPCYIVERVYYKACRPFTVGAGEINEWKTWIKSDRFISLQGLILNGRLTPVGGMPQLMTAPSEYSENLVIEIRALKQQYKDQQQRPSDNSDAEEEGEDVEDTDQGALPRPIWRYSAAKLPSKYNCDLSIRWGETVIISPDCDYEIKLLWGKDAYGAEYPCSLQSTEVDGIQFKDSIVYYGSLIKGLHYINLT